MRWGPGESSLKWSVSSYFVLRNCYFQLGFPATAGSVLGASTGAEVVDIFPGPEHRSLHHLRQFCHSVIELLEVAPHPTYTGHFDFAVRSNPENRGHVGESISVGHGVCSRVIQKQRERNAVLPGKSHRVFLIVLRNAYEVYVFVPISLVESVEKRERILARRTGDLEKCGNHRPTVEGLVQGKLFALQGAESEVGSNLSWC